MQGSELRSSAAGESLKKVPLSSFFLRLYFTFESRRDVFVVVLQFDAFINHFLAELGPLTSYLASVHAAAELRSGLA